MNNFHALKLNHLNQPFNYYVDGFRKQRSQMKTVPLNFTNRWILPWLAVGQLFMTVGWTKVDLLLGHKQTYSTSCLMLWLCPEELT